MLFRSYKGDFNGIDILDDYAHHPTEIKATLKALNNRKGRKLYCIFQPHTFTRTKSLLNGFSDSFTLADKVIVTDIYAAREKDNGEIHARDLAEKIKEKNPNTLYISTFEEIEDYLVSNTRKGDIILTMGAGNVYLIGESILKRENIEILETVVV